MDASTVRRAAELLLLLERLDEVHAKMEEDKTFRLRLDCTDGEGHSGITFGEAVVENYVQACRILRMARLDVVRELTEELGVKLDMNLARAPR